MRPSGKFGIVLTLLAGAGMIFTMYLTAKKAPEALKLKEEALEAKRQNTGDENAELTFMESAKAQAPCYGPVAVSAIATVGALVGSQILPQNALDDLNKVHKTYKNITSKVNGKKAEELIQKMTNHKLEHGSDVPIKETFVIELGEDVITFDSTILQVMQAAYDINKLFNAVGTVTINEMLNFFKQKEIENGNDFGWNIDLGEIWYGYSWIDIEFTRKGKLNGQDVTFIDFVVEPHSLTEDVTLEDVRAENMSSNDKE